jgi:hypothetical protein
MKTIITFLTVLLLAITTITSCTKDNTSVDTSVMGYLTQKQWQLDTLYNNYTGPGTGTIVFVRGGSSNTVNLTNVRDIYWPDGTTEYFDNSGTYSAGTWSITNADSTNLTAGSSHGKILKLDATHFNFFDSANNALNIQVYKP